MEKYPQLTINHFYNIPVYNGGISVQQLNILYEQASIRDYNNFRNMAALHDKKMPEHKSKTTPNTDNMTEEEKQRETERQMRGFLEFFGQDKVDIADHLK